MWYFSLLYYIIPPDMTSCCDHDGYRSDRNYRGMSKHKSVTNNNSKPARLDLQIATYPELRSQKPFWTATCTLLHKLLKLTYFNCKWPFLALARQLPSNNHLHSTLSSRFNLTWKNKTSCCGSLKMPILTLFYLFLDCCYSL